MNWKFWKKTSDRSGSSGAKISRSTRPKDLPEAVGRKMVVGMKLDPDMVWALKYVSRPTEGNENTREFRLFNPDKARCDGIAVTDWSALDDWPKLILYSGSYNKRTNDIDIREGE